MSGVGSVFKNKLIMVVPVAMLAAILACSGGSSATEAPAKQPEKTEAPTEETDNGSSGSEGTVSLDIVNSGDTDVCEVYIAIIDDKSWGDDQLNTKKILAGDTFTLTDIPEGMYDMQALDCDGNVISREVNQDLSGGDFTWTVVDDTVSLTVTNKSDSIGCKVFVAEPDDKYWGPNLVDEGETIDPGTSYVISGIEPGIYDIHVETCSGNYTWDSTGLDLTEDNVLNMNN